MNTTENPNQEPPKRARSPWWIWLVAAPILYGVVPWAISFLTPRYGWAAGYPGPWNLVGLIAAAAGATGLTWSVALHVAQSREGIEMVLAKDYLLTRGIYAFTRNPTYLSILILLFGWVIFYGSVAVLIAFAFAYVGFRFVAVPREERAMEGRWGDAYRAYKNKVPRWLGRTRP